MVGGKTETNKNKPKTVSRLDSIDPSELNSVKPKVTLNTAALLNHFELTRLWLSLHSLLHVHVERPHSTHRQIAARAD